MLFNYRFPSSFLLLFILLLTTSCEKENDGDEVVISSFSSDESHNNGDNCMNCHVSGEDGEGWFIVAGSVFDSTKINPYPNAEVLLYTGPNGTGNLIKTIEVDLLGNFYTTEDVSFADGLYTSVISTEGEETFMNTMITSGQCNACHGVSAERIAVH